MDQITVIPLRTKITSNIRKAILSGEMESGRELSLTEIAQQFGVSRTPVREAFQALENDGLITLRMNKSAIVNRIDERFITDHYEMRILLEGEAAYRAAKRGLETQPLMEACELMRSALENGNAQGYTDLNQRIHTRIWAAAQNQKLYVSLMSMWNGPSIGLNTDSAKHRYLSNNEHIEILESIRYCDAENARLGMRRHIERSMDNILRSYRSQFAEASK